jgi:hypothetical protein
MASDHNVWCCFLIFQAVEMLTLVAYIPTPQCSVFALGTDRVLTHFRTAYSQDNLRNQFAPVRDDITTIRLREIVWYIPFDQDGVVDLERQLQDLGPPVDNAALCCNSHLFHLSEVHTHQASNSCLPQHNSWANQRN